MPVGEQQREQNHARQLLKGERRTARDVARNQAFEAVNQLRGAEPPDWFTLDQQVTFSAELRRLRDRIGQSSMGRQVEGEATLRRAG